MNTIIVSTFPGCGKTYLSLHQEKYSILDAESSLIDRLSGWEKRYVDFIENMIGLYDIILISQHDKVLLELHMRNISFYTVAPDNSHYLSERDRLLIKQQWFGRFILRDNPHINNLDVWMSKLMLNYDDWTNSEKILELGSKRHFPLKANQYLSDIIDDIYIHNAFCP